MADGFSRYLDLRQLARKLRKDNDEWFRFVRLLQEEAFCELRPGQQALLSGETRGY